MTIERFKNLQGRTIVKITNDGKHDPNELAATFIEGLMGNSPEGRIGKIRRHQQLQETADYLAQLFTQEGFSRSFEVRLMTAEKNADFLDLSPVVQKQLNFEEGRKKSRKRQMPELDRWLEEIARQNPKLKVEALVAMLPAEKDDDVDGDVILFRRGEGEDLRIVERVSGRERQIKLSSLRARVTKVRS